MKNIVFVSDLFVDQYAGGAELTTEAIISKAPQNYKVQKINCNELTNSFIDQNKEAHYIICNFSSLDNKIKINICKNVNYSMIEYDYKFCKYRSIEKHLNIENKKCDCALRQENKVNLAFYGYARKIWFMSEKQRQIFLSHVTTIKEEKTEVLSSVFSDGDLRFIDSIKNNPKNDKYLILGSNSWIKGTQKSIQLAELKKIKYEIVSGMPYHELLIKMSTSKGLIFTPLGSDTCPRIVIEAKLLGCDLWINEYVQHREEEWFLNQEDCMSYLKERGNHFWSYYA